MDFLYITLGAMLLLAWNTGRKMWREKPGKRLAVIWSWRRGLALLVILSVHVIERSIEHAHLKHALHESGKEITGAVNTHSDKNHETLMSRVSKESVEIRSAIQNLPLPPQEILVPPSDDPGQPLDWIVGQNRIINYNKDPEWVFKMGTSLIRASRKNGELSISCKYVGENGKPVFFIDRNKFYREEREGYRMEWGDNRNTVNIFNGAGERVLHCSIVSESAAVLTGTFWTPNGAMISVTESGIIGDFDFRFGAP